MAASVLSRLRATIRRRRQGSLTSTKQLLIDIEGRDVRGVEKLLTTGEANVNGFVDLSVRPIAPELQPSAGLA